jgi:hypothetical protein
MEEMLEGFVESPDAAKTGGEGDFGHGHSGFVDELLGEENAAGLRYGDGRGSQMLMEEAAELALADAEAFGECFYGCAVAVEGAVGDEGEGAGDGVRGSTPGGEIGGCLGSAAQAGAETGLLRGRSGGEETSVFVFRGAGWTDGPAVDAGGGDAYEEEAVEAGITALQGAIANLSTGEFHVRIFSSGGGVNWRFSDMVIFGRHSGKNRVFRRGELEWLPS